MRISGSGGCSQRRIGGKKRRKCSAWAAEGWITAEDEGLVKCGIRRRKEAVEGTLRESRVKYSESMEKER